jgi:hypothetical protein
MTLTDIGILSDLGAAQPAVVNANKTIKIVRISPLLLALDMLGAALIFGLGTLYAIAKWQVGIKQFRMTTLLAMMPLLGRINYKRQVFHNCV